MRLSYKTLSLLARAGDVDALNTLEAWEKQENPDDNTGKVEVYLLGDPPTFTLHNPMLYSQPMPRAHTIPGLPLGKQRSRLPTLVGMNAITDEEMSYGMLSLESDSPTTAPEISISVSILDNDGTMDDEE